MVSSFFLLSIERMSRIARIAHADVVRSEVSCLVQRFYLDHLCKVQENQTALHAYL